MSLVIPEGFGSVALVHNETLGVDVGTEPFIWTFGIEQEIGGTTSVSCDLVMEAWADNLAGDTWIGLGLTRVDITIPAPGGGTGVVTSTAEAENGTSGIDPVYSCLVPKVRKLTDLPGRKYRGLFHPPGLLDIEHVNGDGFITSGRRDAIEAACEAFFAQVGGLVGTPVLLHSDPGIEPTPMTGLSVAPKVGVLRNRLL